MNTIKVALVVQNCLAGNYEKNLESTRDFIRFNRTGRKRGYKSIDNSEGVHIVTIEKTVLSDVRSNPMRYFLPNRRTDLFQ